MSKLLKKCEVIISQNHFLSNKSSLKVNHYDCLRSLISISFCIKGGLYDFIRTLIKWHRLLMLLYFIKEQFKIELHMFHASIEMF